jgi:peptidoglycan hydrolase-like protein with peptidoglycan-binding domain
MSKRAWLSIFGAALLLGAAPVPSGASRPPRAQSSTSASSTKKAKTRKHASSKSKKKSKVKAQLAPTPDRIKEIQSALQREGVYDGESTGKWDVATVEAMRKYQDKNGLSPTGKIDALTLEKLGLGSGTAGKGAPLPTASSSPAPSPEAQPASTSAAPPSDPPVKQ